MNEIKLKGLEQSVYTETLNNGLEIYLVPYENKKNYFISYATKFGSDVIEFTEANKKTFKPPLGIAHFLEHKMFETDDGVDPFTFFSESGTDSNASTSFDHTQYICSGTKKFRENLRYLLKFVNSPYFTDENVNKEKGIIAEEINMYQDIPDYKLEMKIREAVYTNSPRSIDIAGTVEEINKITKEDLYSCYNNFYKPNNMFILVVGNFKISDAIEVIKEELNNKETTPIATIKEAKETIFVREKEIILKENVEVPKLAFALKVPTKKLSLKDIELDLYLSILSSILFGASSEFRERCRVAKLLNGIYTEWESIKDFKTLFILATSLDPDKLLDEIKYELKNLSITEKTFERIKKVWIANEVKMIDNIDATVNNMFDDIIKYNKIIPNRIELIREMNLKTLEKLIKEIDFKNISIVKMINKNK